MGLISALNDLAVMSEQSQLIVHQGSTLFTNIIYNSFDCWQSSANTSQASFISGGNLHSCSMLSHPCRRHPWARHPCGRPEQTQVGRDALALGPLQKLPVPGLLGFLGIESFPLSSPQLPPPLSMVSSIIQGDWRAEAYHQGKTRDTRPLWLNLCSWAKCLVLPFPEAAREPETVDWSGLGVFRQGCWPIGFITDSGTSYWKRLHNAKVFSGPLHTWNVSPERKRMSIGSILYIASVS